MGELEFVEAVGDPETVSLLPAMRAGVIACVYPHAFPESGVSTVCAAPSGVLFAGVPLFCMLQLGHERDRHVYSDGVGHGCWLLDETGRSMTGMFYGFRT